MAKQVKVIFKETKKGQFMVGQEKTVKAGYARNYLFPFDLAVPVSEGFKKELERLKKKASVKQAEIKTQAESLKKVLDKQTIEIIQKTHDQGQLYGAVHAADVAEKINAAFKTEVDKLDLKMLSTIKEVGEYAVSVALHPEVKISLTLVVGSENEKIAREVKATEVEEEESEEKVEEDEDATEE